MSDPEIRVAAVRRRLGELAGPDPEDDREFFGELWAAFASHAPGEIESLDGALRRAALVEVEKLAHCLKGSAQNLGGVDLAQHLLGVELDAMAGRPSDVGVVELVRREYDLFAEAYADVLRDGGWHVAR